MDIRALGALIGFAVQIGAGVAPVKYPNYLWLADFLFWGSCLFAIVCLGLWAYSNRAAIRGWMIRMEPSHIIIVGLLIALAGAGWLIFRSPPQQPIGASATTTAPSQIAPPPQTTELAKKASVKLLVRPNQDPQELAKTNVWRWFVFRIAGKDPKGKPLDIGAYIFIVFDKPVATKYRRAFSPSNPEIRFEIMEITERAMVVGANNTNLSGMTVEIEVGDEPL